MEIEKGVILPTIKYKWKTIAKKMEIGDSVFLETMSQYSSLRCAMDRCHLNWQSRKEKNGRRLWRVE